MNGWGNKYNRMHSVLYSTQFLIDDTGKSNPEPPLPPHTYNPSSPLAFHLVYLFKIPAQINLTRAPLLSIYTQRLFGAVCIRPLGESKGLWDDRKWLGETKI